MIIDLMGITVVSSLSHPFCIEHPTNQKNMHLILSYWSGNTNQIFELAFVVCVY